VFDSLVESIRPDEAIRIDVLRRSIKYDHSTDVLI